MKMGSKIKLAGIGGIELVDPLEGWVKRYTKEKRSRPSEASQIQMQTMNKEMTQIAQTSDLATIAINEEATTSVTELPWEAQEPFQLS